MSRNETGVRVGQRNETVGVPSLLFAVKSRGRAYVRANESRLSCDIDLNDEHRQCGVPRVAVLFLFLLLLVIGDGNQRRPCHARSVVVMLCCYFTLEMCTSAQTSVGEEKTSKYITTSK